MDFIKGASNLLNTLDQTAGDTLQGEEEERQLAERRAKRRAEKLSHASSTSSLDDEGNPGQSEKINAPPAKSSPGPSKGGGGSQGDASSDEQPSGSPTGSVAPPVAALNLALSPQTNTSVVEPDGDVSSIFTGPETQQLRLAKQEILRLRRDAKQLALSVEDAEERMEDMAVELRAAGDAIAAGTRSRAEREMELEQETSEVRKAKETDRAAMVATLKDRDAEVESLEEEVAESRSSQGLLRKELEAMLAKLDKAHEAKRSVEDELRECQGRVSESADALRAQLRRVEQQHEDASLSSAAWRREAQRREANLEQANASMGASLAQTQRKLTETQQQLDQTLSGKQDSSEDAAYSEVVEELKGCRTMLEAERQQHHACQVHLRRAQLDLSEAKASHDEECRRLRRTVAEAEEVSERVRNRLREEEERQQLKRGDGGDGVDEKRLEAMSAQLLKKQIQLDDLVCAKSALTARLRAAQQRADKLEQSAAAMSAVQLSSMRGDNSAESGGLEEGVVRGGGRGGANLRQRSSSSNSSAVPIARLPPFAKHENIAKVADTVDKWSLWVGLYLRNNAYARLYFLIYVLLLHTWMFILISFKVHSFEEVHGDHQIGFPGIMQPSGQLSQQAAIAQASSSPLAPPLLLEPAAVEQLLRAP